MDELPPPCEMDPGQAQPVEEVHDLEIVDDPHGFSTFLYPCVMRSGQVPLVTSLVDRVPGLEVVVGQTECAERVKVTIIVPSGANMPFVFGELKNSLNPPIPINTEVSEGRVFGTCEEPQSLSIPRPNPISLLRRVSSTVRGLIPHSPART